MRYELAKQLKDAGFPQEDALYYFTDEMSEDSDPMYYAGIETPMDDDIAAPTLEELIEACGDEITSMYRADKLSEGRVWVVKCCDRETHVGIGVTLTIAVAHLYLDLNPPNQETK